MRRLNPATARRLPPLPEWLERLVSIAGCAAYSQVLRLVADQAVKLGVVYGNPTWLAAA
jgi:hypothetical protein